MLPPGDRLLGSQARRQTGESALCHPALEFILKHLRRVTSGIKDLVAAVFCKVPFLLCLYGQNEPKDRGTPPNSLLLSTQPDWSPALTIFFWALSTCEFHTA